MTISASHTFVTLLDVAPDRAGITAAWTWQDGIGAAATGGSAVAAAPAGSSLAFAPEWPAPATTLSAHPYGHGRTLALTYRVTRVAAPQRIAVGFATAGPIGAFGRTRTIASGQVIGRPVLAVAPNGRALIAYVEQDAHHRRVVRVAVRAPGRPFGAAASLTGTDQADLVTAAVSARGDLAVVFARRDGLYARVRRPAHAWGSLRLLDRAPSPSRWAPAVAITSTGRVVVAWRRTLLSRPGHAAVRSLRATTTAPARGRFATTQVLDVRRAGVPVLAQDAAAGVALTVTHDDIDAGGVRRYTPRAHLLAPGGRFGAALVAGPARGGLRGVAVTTDPRAGTTVAWVQPLPGGDGDGQALSATLAPQATAFGPAEAITPPENVHEVWLASDPADGRTVAVWSARPGGTGPSVPLGDIATVVRSAAGPGRR